MHWDPSDQILDPPLVPVTVLRDRGGFVFALCSIALERARFDSGFDWNTAEALRMMFVESLSGDATGN